MRVELQRGLLLDLPFYYDISEGKAALAFSIWEDPSGSPARIDAGEISRWIREIGGQKFPGSGSSYVITYKCSHNIRYISFLYQGHPAPGAYMEVDLTWNPVAIDKNVLGSGGKVEKLPVSMGGSEGTVHEKEATKALEATLREKEAEIQRLQWEIKKSKDEFASAQRNLADLKKNEAALADLKKNEAALTALNGELKKLVEQQAEATFRTGGEYEKELERLKAVWGADSEAMKALDEMRSRRQEIEAQNKERDEEAGKLKSELASLEKKNADQDREMREQKADIARLDALSQENQEMLEQNRERLAQDEELLRFLKNNDIDVDKSLKEIEKLLKDTEEQMRRAIKEKEEKEEAIRRMAGGEKG